MTVHIVEDDIGVRDALSELCRSIGRRVKTYADGESFQTATGIAPTDVVLVDLGLPGESGPAVVRRVRALPEPPKVIVISGLPLSDISIAMSGLSDVLVMRKPLIGGLLRELM